mmetsp:Transcript_15795/g.22123  ORF Transcript_15795/g.22123 Transcript_15795/m.22123 type:complete len:128 (-) Transcript_15795:816-1199(-)
MSIRCPWACHMRLYTPPCSISCLWVPDSQICPRSRTMICSACAIVDSLCAMTIHVLFFPSFNMAFWTACSVTLSKDDVASSRSTTGGSLRRHLAMATLCFSPPESFKPLSPTFVSQLSGKRSMKSRI